MQPPEVLLNPHFLWYKEETKSWCTCTHRKPGLAARSGEQGVEWVQVVLQTIFIALLWQRACIQPVHHSRCILKAEVGLEKGIDLMLLFCLRLNSPTELSYYSSICIRTWEVGEMATFRQKTHCRGSNASSFMIWRRLEVKEIGPLPIERAKSKSTISSLNYIPRKKKKGKHLPPGQMPVKRSFFLEKLRLPFKTYGEIRSFVNASHSLPYIKTWQVQLLWNLNWK